MNKEEILAKAQKENKGKDIEKDEADKKSGAIATVVSAIYAGIMFFIELFLTDTYNFSLWAAVTVMNVVINIYMFIRLKKKTYLFAAIVWALWSVGLTIMAISGFVAESTVL